MTERPRRRDPDPAAVLAERVHGAVAAPAGPALGVVPPRGSLL
jgi:hypothetical protein